MVAQNQNYPAVIIVGRRARSSALNPAAGDETTTTMINDTSSPLVLLNDGDDNCGRGEHKHDDDSVSTTSDITFSWRENDDYLGDLAEIHDPGYYELSLKPEQSPMVSCIQDDEPNSKGGNNGDGDHPDATAESQYIDEIVELKLQLANRRAEIDELKACLNRCMSDKEVLEAETNALVDEIAQQHQYKQSGLDLESSNRSGLSFSAPFLRNNILSKGRRKSNQRKNGSIQMLLESNSQLLLKNSQLQIENNALRKSLQARIVGNRQRQRKLDDQEITSYVQPLRENGKKRGSSFTNETEDETLSVTSPMPEHWPSLEDPYLSR